MPPSPRAPPRTPTTEPRCDPRPATCAPLDVDPARCIDDPELFVAVVAQGTVVGARLQPTALDALALELGAWHVRYPDPDGGCDDLVVPFATGDTVLAQTTARRHPGADGLSVAAGKVERAWAPGEPAWSASRAAEAAR